MLEGAERRTDDRKTGYLREMARNAAALQLSPFLLR